MQEEITLQTDPLAVGLTRPAMWMNVPIKCCFVNITSTTFLYIYIQSFWVLLLFPLLHGFCVWGTYNDPRWFEGLCRAFSKTPPTLNKAWWGQTNSYEPW